MTRPAFELHVADCVAWLRTLDDASAHCIVTDPAYESLEKHRAIGTTTRLQSWFSIFANARFPELLAEIERVLVDNAHLYVLSDQETAFVLRPMIEAAGLHWWKLLIWEKTRERERKDDVDGPGPSAGMGYHYRSAHEVVTFAEKGKRRLNDLGICDVLRFPRVRNGYPTEKPVGLLRTLIEQSTSPGELVLDPFLGSGSTGEAALASGRRFAGCDLSDDAVDRARTRLLRFGTAAKVARPRRQGELFG